MTLNLILLIALIALQIGDGVTTYINLRRPGGKEHNALIRKLIDRLGMIPALVVKGLIVAGLAYGIYAMAPYLPLHFATIVLAAAAAFYAYIVAKNASYFL